MKIYLKKSITLILALTFCASFLYAEGIEKGKKNAAKQVAGSPTSTMFNINNISTWVYDDGKSDINKAGDSGFMYPKGSGKTVFFQSGPIWGGSMAGYYTIGGSAYRQGLKHGRIRPDGTADVEATGGNKIRIYRVRSDYKDFSTIDEMKLLFASEIKLEGATAEAVYAQYDLDWNQWPAAWGAPFIDKNGDGVYDPTVDVPGMGDPVEDPPCQTIWWVANDLDQATTVYLYGGLPMKVEVQATFWGYKRNGALGNTMFRKYKLINKNTINFDSMYMCMWSDPDVGGGFDDFAGCDTSLSLGFVYNGAPRDDIYADTPPAAGFDFFQGPRIPGLPTDYAQYNGKWVQGYKGLGMTSFFYFSQGVEPDFSDPDQGVYAGVKQWRNMFEGKKSRSGTAYLDYVTGKPTKFPLSGDPILGTGWIDGMLHVKNDRRFGQVSGPFTMNAGDTQEVVVGQLVAGAFPGVGRIAAVGLLKFYDKSAQGAYDNSFKIPPPPPPPAVTVTELNNEIVLQWYNEAAFAKSETFNKQDFKFEGYNIYQAANTNVTLNDIVDGKKLKRIATYDIRNNVAAIVCDDADATSGVLIKKVLAFGTDSGIQRYYDFKSDMLNGIPLYNGSKYYYAVTAYAYNSNPSAIPNVLESSLVITTATPQPNLPGDRLPNGTTDVLTVNHVSGVSSAVVAPVVVDPKKVAAHSYEVYFTDVAGTLTWNMKEGSTVVLAEQKILPNKSTGDIQNTVIDGVQVQVSGPATREIRDAVATKGKNPFDSTASAGIWGVASGVALNEELWKKGLALGKYWFNGTTLVDDNGYHDVIIKFADVNSAGVFSATDPNASKGYRYLRAAGSAPALPEFAPFIKNTSTNYGFQEFGLNGGPNIPLAAFDVKTGKRLALAHVENNVKATTAGDPAGLVDGKYYPRANVTNTNTREALLILAEEYSTTPNSAYTASTFEVLTNGHLPIMYFFTCSRVSDFKSDTELLIRWWEPITTNDRYTFSVSAINPRDPALTKSDVDKVNVFPNPYYGANPQEINKYNRFITFSHLPVKATIKIFNISGQLVRTINKDDSGQFLRWDLATDSGLPVASGIYVAYIDMPDQGVVKKLKVAIIQEQQILDRF